VGRLFPSLSYLSLLKNPCTPNPFVEENREKYQQYRHFIIARLPKLQTLDAEPVRESERKFIATKKLDDLPSPIPPDHGTGSLPSAVRHTHRNINKSHFNSELLQTELSQTPIPSCPILSHLILYSI